MISEPINKNYLYPNKWIFTLHNTPNLVYFCQSVFFPGVSTTPVKLENPFSPVFFTPDKMSFESLNLTFILDEDMRTWEETFNWMKGNTFPTDHKEYIDQKKKNHYSDATLQFNTNNNTSNFKVKFLNCFPINLNGFTMDFESSPDSPLTSSVTFQYDRFIFERNS